MLSFVAALSLVLLSESTPVPQPEPTGLIRGQVIDEANLEPVKEVGVFFAGDMTWTNEKGWYEIPAPLGGGQFNLSFEHPDYFAVTVPTRVVNGVIESRDVLVVRTHSFGGVGSLSGNILLLRREPGRARITSPNHSNFHFDTREDGTFSVDLVPAGFYQVQIAAEGYASRVHGIHYYR